MSLVFLKVNWVQEKGGAWLYLMWFLLKANLKPFSDTKIRSLGNLLCRNVKYCSPNQLTNRKDTIRTSSCIYMMIFSEGALQNELYKLILLELYLHQTTPPTPLHNHCTYTRTREKAHCKSSACTRFGNKEYVWNCRKNFNIPKCQGREPLQLIGYLVPMAKLLTCWQITQTRN